MDINKLNEQLEKLLELKRDDMESGHKVNADNFPEAVQKIYELYKQGRLNVYCPDVFEFKYIGQVYALCAVSGKRNKHGNIKYGIAHSLNKHSNEIVDGRIVTEEQLVRAMKRTQEVLQEKLESGRGLFYNAELNRIIFEKDKYVYSVVLPDNDKEVCYLQTVFKADKSYLKRLKNKYKQM